MVKRVPSSELKSDAFACLDINNQKVRVRWILDSDKVTGKQLIGKER